MFHETLKKIRLELGHKSGKSFYKYLNTGDKATFNYSYYTKIESGAALPSYSVVNEISTQLNKSKGQLLVISYCKDVFPSFSTIFKEEVNTKNKIPTDSTSHNSSRNLQGVNQNELSLKQVFKICESFNHYMIFIILSLSRVPLKLGYLNNFLDFSTKGILIELSEIGVIHFDGTQASYASIEQKFPSVVTDSRLMNLYQRLDSWDIKIQSFLNFKERKKKFFIRRTSKKHSQLLKGLLDQLDSIVKISDEIDPSLNDEVVVIEYKLTEGKMPG